MRKTPWAKHSSGSLPSDRIKPSAANTAPYNQASPATSRGRKNREPAKSREVLRLEALVEGLQDNTQTRADPHRGCFCQARLHSLSPYTPICRNCGLILCELHQPFYICPNGACSSVLLTPTARDALIAQLQVRISDILVREEEARQRAIQDAREAEGAFPALRGAPGGGEADTLRSHPVNQTSKVLSLNSKTRKFVVSTYTPSSSPSRSSSLSGRRGEDTENEVGPEVKRVPAPSKSVEPIELRWEVGEYIPAK